MSQQRFYIGQQMPGSGSELQKRNDFYQQNFVPNVQLSSYGELDNVKTEQKNQLFINKNNYEKKNRTTREDESREENNLYDIEKKRKKQKYKRSTNNSHKKFISALRRLFYSVISSQHKDEFQKEYGQYKSCRTFFFIILAYMKHRFSQRLMRTVQYNFEKEMTLKIREYTEQAKRTKNNNLKNFREEEIIDIRYSIASSNQFINGDARKAVECMYKKDKTTVVKRQHFQQAVKSINKIQKQLYASSNNQPRLQQPYIEDYSNSSERQKILKKTARREIRQNQMNRNQEGRSESMDHGFNMNDQYQGGKKERDLRRTKPAEEESEEESISGRYAQQVDEFQLLYPPLLEAIPFIKYDPFVPPFRYKRQTRYRMDVREDFFGPFNYGFPKYNQTAEEFMSHNPQFGFPWRC